MTDRDVEFMARVAAAMNGQDPDESIDEDGAPCPIWKDYCKEGRRGLAYMAAHGVKMTTREATGAMMDKGEVWAAGAYCDSCKNVGSYSPDYCFENMHDAAPLTPAALPLPAAVAPQDAPNADSGTTTPEQGQGRTTRDESA